MRFSTYKMCHSKELSGTKKIVKMSADGAASEVAKVGLISLTKLASNE